jgi:hypothetical protein
LPEGTGGCPAPPETVSRSASIIRSAPTMS